jgi:hypothetical protein
MPSLQQPQPVSCNIQGQRGMPVPEQSFQLATVSHLPTGTGFTTSASASSVLQLSTNLPPNASSN